MIIFMGPLPPPVHGFSLVNQKMYDALSKDADVVRFDLTPQRIKHGLLLSRIQRIFFLPFMLIRFVWAALSAPRGSSFYIGLSGGMGQLLDLLFLLVARLAGLRIFIHHHSFAYINRRSLVATIVLRLSGGATHIVLCEDMGRALSRIYNLSIGLFFSLSNAAFMEFKKSKPSSVRGAVTLGYLSNITAEKGIFDFLDLMDELVEEGAPVIGVIAGPVDEKVRQQFKQRLAALDKHVVHKGPLYGLKKDSFLKSLDLIVFPTRYNNEAEPLVLWEGMAAGAIPVSTERGCIPCVIPPDKGLVVAQDQSFVKVVVPWLLDLISDRAMLKHRKEHIVSYFGQSKDLATEHFQKLLVMIKGVD